jgi:pimeloyl-ACP methyl ester carboxylesterase
MFVRRAGLLRAQQPFRLNARRAFSTTELDSGVKIAFDLFEPEKEATAKDAPIVFIHGLFGSKRNNGSMSKYAPAYALLRGRITYNLAESLPAS